MKQDFSLQKIDKELYVQNAHFSFLMSSKPDLMTRTETDSQQEQNNEPRLQLCNEIIITHHISTARGFNQQ